MTEKIDKVLESHLEQRKIKGGYRKLRPLEEDKIDFSSNDYLGLSKIKAIHEASNDFVDNGASGSRLLNGNKSYHEEVETFLANYFNAESTLIYNSGYLANLGVLSCIPQKGDTVLMDELSHICIKEGVRLSRANYFNFKHNDLHDLELKLQKAQGNIFIVVESIYSMDGDTAPLHAIVQLAKAYAAAVIVDEAHSTGLYGFNGNGYCCDLGLEESIFARIYTFGKAPGAHGAAVAGSSLLKEYLVNYSRQFIYTTALPYHSIRVIKNAVEYRKNHPELWVSLQQNIQLFKKLLNHNISLIASEHAIQGIIFSNANGAVEFADYLNDKQYDVRPILSPTVPKGKERVRICIHAFNSEEEITNLCTHINAYFE